MSGPEGELLEEIFRREWGRLIATLVRLVGDLGRAEELGQEALVAALESCPSRAFRIGPGHG